MPPILKARQTLSDMLRDRLIPAATGRNASILLMEPFHLTQRKYPFRPHLGQPLDDSGSPISSLFLNEWKNQNVHSIRYPCLMAVVEGEIDWRVGVTRSMLEHRQLDWGKYDYFVVPVRATNFFLIPPGVPYSMGDFPHWERDIPQEKMATLFWMVAFPSGILCHYCQSMAGKHASFSQVFIPCPEPHQLIQMLLQEMQSPKNQNSLITRAHLQAILGYIYRGLLSSPKLGNIKAEAAMQLEVPKISLPQNAQKRARDYIEANLQMPLTAEIIASHAYLSVRQLDRQFYNSNGMSLMEYVHTRRIARAKVLLQDTDLPIGEIGKTVGYRNPSSFAQTFKRRSGYSPTQYRKMSL